MPSRYYWLMPCNHREKCLFSLLSTKTEIRPIKIVPREKKICARQLHDWQKRNPFLRALNGSLKLTRDIAIITRGISSNKIYDLARQDFHLQPPFFKIISPTQNARSKGVCPVNQFNPTSNPVMGKLS